MTRRASPLTVYAENMDSACLLTVAGVLDSSTYLELRNSVIKAALDQRGAVLVDVSALDVPAPSAWSVFTSARWHVSTWPDVPIILVCGHANGRTAIVRNGVARYVPVYPTVEAALGVLHSRSSGRLVPRQPCWLLRRTPARLAGLRHDPLPKAMSITVILTGTRGRYGGSPR